MNFWKNIFDSSSKTEQIVHVSPLQHDKLEQKAEEDLMNDLNGQGKQEVKELPNIPEELFVEHNPPLAANIIKTRNIINAKNMDPVVKTEGEYNLQYLYAFLEKDYQQEGYNDALSNPDMSNMDEKVKLIRMQLDITIAKVKTAYSSVLRNINFHIDSRSRNGMVDIVDELISKRTTIEEEISKVSEIEKGAKAESGISETLIMSYKLGFKNGYAAISHSQLI